MTAQSVARIEKEVADCWRTDLIDMPLGVNGFSSCAVKSLIRRIGFVEMVRLILRGNLPPTTQAELLSAALTAGVEQDRQASSIALSRISVTYGFGLGKAMASTLDILRNIHGGVGQQAAEIRGRVEMLVRALDTFDMAIAQVLKDLFEAGGQFATDFSHSFHPVDHRAPRPMRWVSEARRHRKGCGPPPASHAGGPCRHPAPQEARCPDEHRRRHCRHRHRFGVRDITHARGFLPVTIRRHPRPCLQASSARRAQEGADTPSDGLDLRQAVWPTCSETLTGATGAWTYRPETPERRPIDNDDATRWPAAQSRQEEG